jgi:hypothetical protein
VADSQSSLLEQVRSGTNRQLQLLAAEGVLPLPPEELIPIQVGLARGGDPEMAGRAAQSLRGIDVRVVRTYLERAAGAEELAFFAASASHPVLIEAILRRRDVPRAVLADLARRLPPDLQELLLLRQDAILELPTILDALEENPQISLYSQRRVGEYRQHLLPKERVDLPGMAEADEIDEAELEAAIEVARELPESGEFDEVRTKLSEGQIRGLPVPMRMKLARGAPRTLRNILLRDTNSMVALATLLSNSLTDNEVEQTASNRAVSDDVLQAISRKREWVNKYPVGKALALNPRTPLPIAIRLISKLSVRDLKDLARDRNVADAVRSTAQRLYRIKQQ